MTTLRMRLQSVLDLGLAVGIACLVMGTTIAFGGAAWWNHLMVAGLTSFLIIIWLIRSCLANEWLIMRSPLTGLGLLALGLALFQSVPMPARFSEIISPRARSIHATGLLVELLNADAPGSVLPDPISDRSPLSIDRPATLRWLSGAVACLATFWIVSHFTDRLERLYLVWGSIVGAFLLNVVIGLIQIVGQSEGLYGFIEPGKGPSWSPNLADSLAAPGETVLRLVDASATTPHTWALPKPVRTQLLGTMMGGPGAFLALGSIGLPLALTITLQLIAPRGSSDGLWRRLTESNQGSLFVLLSSMTVAGAFLVGLLAGTVYAIPFAMGLVIVGLPSLKGSGLRWKGGLATVITLAALLCGVLLGNEYSSVHMPGSKLPRVDFTRARAVWTDAFSIVRDFPVIGTGLGSFASIQPYYKCRDAASSTAMSSLLQWWVESGAVGLSLVGLAILWILVSLPRAIRRVGSADRSMPFGMIGATLCFTLLAVAHWTVELSAVALAASAGAGTCNRWLSGGTDLFVERG